MNKKYTLIVVEDDKLFADNINRLINSDDSLICKEVFGCAEDSIKYLKKNNSVDLLLLDIGLPGIDGLSAIRLFRKEDERIKIMILTVYDDDDYIFKAAKEGANGYLLKGDSDRKILRSIHDILSGGGALNAGVAAKMLNYFGKCKNENEVNLTPGELRILKYFSDGHTKREIAELVERSIHTVDTHIRNIYQKLHVNSRAEAVSKAIKKEII